MVAAQNGECLICYNKPIRLVIDHNHKSGQIRGLLCNACNRGIGFFMENPQSLRRAAEFLERAGC